MTATPLSITMQTALDILNSSTGYGPAGVDNKARVRSMRALVRRGLAEEYAPGWFRRTTEKAERS